MGKDVFGTERDACAEEGCECKSFFSLRDAMTEEECAPVAHGRRVRPLATPAELTCRCGRPRRQAEGAFVSCQRASELFLTCTCGHAAHVHTARKEAPEPGKKAD